MNSPAIEDLTNRIHHAITRTEIADLYESLSLLYRDENDNGFIKATTDLERADAMILARIISFAYRGKALAKEGALLVEDLGKSQDLRPSKDTMSALKAEARAIHAASAIDSTIGLLESVRQTPVSS